MSTMVQLVIVLIEIFLEKFVGYIFGSLNFQSRILFLQNFYIRYLKMQVYPLVSIRLFDLPLLKLEWHRKLIILWQKSLCQECLEFFL
jgi:hypothetical protein